jgi:galactose mutarotase-like enzyme
VRWADRPWSLRISAPDCRFMQVYTRGADGSFCVEAQSSAPDPFRLAADGHDAGLASVPPGGRFTCRTRFEVRPL